MAEIIPAVMPKSFDDLRTHLARVKKLASYVQIDVMDGKFVPGKTWPYEDARTFEKIVKEEEGMPFWEDFNFEIDLMVKNPETVISDWISAGAGRIIIHMESTEKLDDIISEIRSHGDAREGMTVGAIEIGLALNLDTSLEALYPWIPKIDFVQHMGIARIGYQGEPFDNRVIDRITQLRREYPDTIMTIDGGVSLDTAPSLIAAGANRLAVGSALFRSEDIRSTLEEFKNL